METVFTGVITAVISAAAFVRLKDIREDDRKRKNGNKMMWFVTALTVYVTADILTAHAVRNTGAGIISTVSTLIAANFIFLLGFIDFRHRKIPNIYIAAALITRTVLIVLQGIAGHSISGIFIRSFAGLAAGALITGIAYVVSGKGLGAGDVKMFAVIGYFLGGFAVVDILVYSTVFCCICGILLIILRKCRLRDCIPMAPFAYAGTMLYLVAGM